MVLLAATIHNVQLSHSIKPQLHYLHLFVGKPHSVASHVPQNNHTRIKPQTTLIHLNPHERSRICGTSHQAVFIIRPYFLPLSPKTAMYFAKRASLLTWLRLWSITTFFCQFDLIIQHTLFFMRRTVISHGSWICKDNPAYSRKVKQPCEAPTSRRTLPYNV